MAVGEAKVNEFGLDALAQIDAVGWQFLSSSAICCVLRWRRLALGHGSSSLNSCRHCSEAGDIRKAGVAAFMSQA
jgi:hypothetical protein